MPIIGVSFDGFQTLPQSLEIARAAVDAGAKSLWMAEHLGYREPFTSCMAFALRFPGVKVVPTAISPYLRHPMPTAMALATMAEASPGNVAIAIGTGNPLFLAESGLTIDKPVRAMRESAEALRDLLSGAALERTGLVNSFKGARLAFTPAEPIPIYMAAMKEQMLKLAGRASDGVVLSAGLSAGFVKHSLAVSEEGRRAAARTASPFVRSGYVYFLASNTPAEGRKVLRQRLAFLMRNKYIDDNLAHSGLPIDQAAIIDAISRRDFEEAARLVPEEAVDAFTITGTPAQCRDGIQRFIDAGLDEVVLLMAGEPADWAVGYEVMRAFN